MCSRLDVFVIEAGSFGGNLAGSPEDLGCYRIAGCPPAVAGKESLLRLASQASPIDTQLLWQLRAEHDIAIPAALALAHTNTAAGWPFR